MNTRFDHFSDDDIHAFSQESSKNEAWKSLTEMRSESDIEKIGRLAAIMYYWRSWIGPPVTFFDESGLNFDGHHRVRACKFIARRLGMQIHIPVRYDPIMTEIAAETALEVKQMQHDNKASGSDRDHCSGGTGVSESLCK